MMCPYDTVQNVHTFHHPGHLPDAGLPPDETHSFLLFAQLEPELNRIGIGEEVIGTRSRW